VRRAAGARWILPLVAAALLCVRPAGAARMFSLSLEDVADDRGQVIDLSHAFQEGIPLLPGNIPFSPLPGPRTAEGAAGSSFSCGEHTGTHLDAPANFGKGLPSVDEITPVRLMSKGVMIDVRAKTSTNPDYVLTLADLQAWEKANGRVQPHSLVILNTGWYARWDHPDRYLNKDERGAMHFPGFAADAVRTLIVDRNVNGLGIDTPSIDPGKSTTFDAHKAILLGGRYTVENLDNLDLLPARGFSVLVAPMKISRGSGSPARVFAIVPR
jgi:kynurenine formamidase